MGRLIDEKLLVVAGLELGPEIHTYILKFFTRFTIFLKTHILYVTWHKT